MKVKTSREQCPCSSYRHEITGNYICQCQTICGHSDQQVQTCNLHARQVSIIQLVQNEYKYCAKCSEMKRKETQRKRKPNPNA